MKVVIYAAVQKGAFRINNLKTYPRKLCFAHVGLTEKSIEPKKLWFMTRPMDEKPVAMTQEVADRVVNFFKNNFEEFKSPFYCYF